MAAQVPDHLDRFNDAVWVLTKISSCFGDCEERGESKWELDSHNIKLWNLSSAPKKRAK